MIKPSSCTQTLVNTSVFQRHRRGGGGVADRRASGPCGWDMGLSHTHTQSYGLFKLPGFQIWKKIKNKRLKPWALVPGPHVGII